MLETNDGENEGVLKGDLVGNWEGLKVTRLTGGLLLCGDADESTSGSPVIGGIVANCRGDNVNSTEGDWLGATDGVTVGTLDGFAVGALTGGLLFWGAEEMITSPAVVGAYDRTGAYDGLAVGALFIFWSGPMTKDPELTFVIFGTFNFTASSIKVFTNKSELIDKARVTTCWLYIAWEVCVGKNTLYCANTLSDTCLEVIFSTSIWERVTDVSFSDLTIASFKANVPLTVFKLDAVTLYRVCKVINELPNEIVG